MKLMFFVGFACVSGTAFAYNSRKEAKIGTKFTIRRGSAEDLKMQEKIGRKRLGDLAEQLLEKLFKFSWQIKPICQQVRDMFIAEHQGSTRHRPRAYYARPDSTHITKYLFEKGKSDREALTESIENAVKNICNPKTYYITIDGNEYVNYCYPLPRIDYVKGFKLDHKLVTEEIRDYAIFTRTFALTMLIGGMVSDESLLAQLSEYELEIKDLVNQMAQDRSPDCEIFVSEKMFDSYYLSYSWILEIFDSMRSLCSSENSRLKAFIGKIRSTETTDKELLGLLCVDVEMNRPRVKEVLAKLRNEHGVTAQ